MERKGLRVGFVGIGQAGSNFVDLVAASDEGTVDACVAMNTSSADLASLKVIGTSNRIPMTAAQAGAGKDRNKSYDALKMFEEPLRSLKAVFGDPANNVANVDIIFVVFSAGGGTGSGTGPTVSTILHQVYKKHGIKVIAVTMVPSDKEGSAQEHSNAIGCIRELTSTGSFAVNFPIIVVDNGKFDKDDANMSVRQKRFEINKLTIDNLLAFVRFNGLSSVENIDDADRMSVLSEPGIITLNSESISPVEGDLNPLDVAIKKAMAKSPTIADTNISPKKVAIQFECEDKFLSQKHVNQLSGLFKNAIGRFNGFYDPITDTASSSIINRVLVVTSGGVMSKKWIAEREALVAALQVTENKVVEEEIFSENDSWVKTEWAKSEKEAEEEAESGDIVTDVMSKITSLRNR